MHIRQPTYPAGTTQQQRAVIDEAISVIKAALETGPYFPPYSSSDLPPVTNDLLYRGIFISTTGKPAVLVPGTPNAWKYFDGSAV